MKRFLLINIFLLIGILLQIDLPGKNSKDYTISTSRQRALLQIKTTTITGNQIKNIIKLRNGKILFLDVWATWCIPCKEEFPALIQLQDYYKNNDVEIIAISVDYPDELQSKVIPMLSSLNINFKTFVADLTNDTELINLLNPQWNGAIPAAFIFNKDGKETAFLQGQQSIDDFKSAIDKVRNTAY